MKQASKDCLTCLGCLLLVLLVSAIGYLGILVCATAPMVQNTLHHVILSPDGRLKVTVFERNSGATTGFSTQVSILASDEDLPTTIGNVLGMDGHPEHTRIHAEWVDNESVRISYTLGYGDRVSYQNKRVGRVRILIAERSPSEGD